MTGQRVQHPDNHFVVIQFLGIPDDIAIRFRELVTEHDPNATPPQVRVNDTSIERGGRFDIGPPDEVFWEYPHEKHRVGCEMDINFLGQHCSHEYWRLMRQAIIEAIDPLEPNPPPMGEHHDLDCNHLHVYFRDPVWE